MSDENLSIIQKPMSEVEIAELLRDMAFLNPELSIGIRRLAFELGTLRSLIKTWPRTADGITPATGQQIWGRNARLAIVSGPFAGFTIHPDDGPDLYLADELAPGCSWEIPATECYSSEDAATTEEENP